MSPEEFDRLKEQHKAHLREMKRLKGLAHEAGRKGRLAQALENIAASVSPDATYDEMLDKLNRDTALAEARFEVAQEQARSPQAEADDALARAADEEAREAALARDRARSLVEQIKGQMGGPLPDAPPATDAAPKTLGRTRPESGGDAPAAERPDKTLGRRS